ncbi:MAG: glutamate synthase central domain-containing protein, partial [Pseudomonadota bacterium]
MLAHNGEINTIRGNTNWMRSHERKMASDTFGDHGEDVKPVIPQGASDSAALDAVYELLVRSGRNAPMAKALLIPEAWSKRSGVMREDVRALYEYCNAVMEPWDGPAAICAFDGRWALAGLDRNGLRPLRYALTEDGLLAVGSESGMCPLGDKRVLRRGAVPAGGMIAVDLETKRFLNHSELMDDLVLAHPYRKWLDNITELDPLIRPGPEARLFEEEDLGRRQRMAGYTQEDLDLILTPMAETGKEAIGSMGDDTPLAFLSPKYRPLSHFFRQRFSQVTNPPIDPLREGRVMSLKTRFKNLGNILAEDETQTDVFVLEGPVLTNGMYQRMREKLGDAVKIVDCTFDARNPDDTLAGAIDRIRTGICEAVAAGAAHIVLTDRHLNASRAPVPMILAISATHKALVEKGLRSQCSLTVRSGECLDSHYCAVLIGVGATCVSPYLAFETIAERHAQGRYQGKDLGTCVANYKTALENGLLKILSKMGVSVLSAYRGGCNFETLGLSRSLLDEYLTGATSRLSGLGLSGLETMIRELHAEAFDQGVARLPLGSFYRVRTGGEPHAYQAPAISDLQKAVRENDYTAYKRWSGAIADNSPIQIRDLLTFRPQTARAIETVESVNAIRKRFVTPGMSLGALSKEAHGVLNIAMNRIGAKSV